MSGVRDLADVGGLRGGQLVPMERATREPRGRARKADDAPRIFLRGDHVELAERTVEDVQADAPFAFAEGKFWQYDRKRGIFVVVQLDALRRRVMAYRGAPVRKGEDKTRALNLTCAAVDGSISLASALVSDDTFFEGARPGIAFADCFIEVTATGIVQHEHSPDHRARFAYDFAFVPHARPAELLAFYESVWRDDAPEDRAAKIALNQEYVGASMLGVVTSYQRAVAQVGDGANGKSVASAIVDGCMPPGSVCSIPPQDVGQEYRRAMLAGKLLNIVSELPESDILDSESWKAVVAGDAMTGREIHKSPFQFRPKAGHIYSANRLPGTTDHTAGFWRRMIVVRFDRVFAEHEQEAGLADRILAQERPAMVSWFLAGAQRVLASGRLTIPPSAAAAIDGWKRASDQVLAFVEERCERLTLEAPTSTWCPSSKLYSAFRSWSEDNGHRPVASNKFAERMRLLGLGVTKGRLGNLYPVALKGGEAFHD